MVYQMNKTNPNDPILVAIDFSTDSEAALLWANNYTKCSKSPLIILHVIHDPADAPGFYYNNNELSKPMNAVAKRMADEFMQTMFEKHPSLTGIHNAEVTLVKGLPPGRIIEFAAKEQAQLIVLGSCGRTGLTHILLGSVAERVAQLAKIPVVIVKTPNPNDDHNE